MSKARITELQQKLHKAAGPERDYLIEMLELMLDQVKDQLVTASGDYQLFQGEARMLRRLHAAIKTGTPVKQETI